MLRAEPFKVQSTRPNAGACGPTKLQLRPSRWRLPHAIMRAPSTSCWSATTSCELNTMVYAFTCLNLPRTHCNLCLLSRNLPFDVYKLRGACFLFLCDNLSLISHVGSADVTCTTLHCREEAAGQVQRRGGRTAPPSNIACEHYSSYDRVLRQQLLDSSGGYVLSLRLLTCVAVYHTAG